MSEPGTMRYRGIHTGYYRHNFQLIYLAIVKSIIITIPVAAQKYKKLDTLLHQELHHNVHNNLAKLGKCNFYNACLKHSYIQHLHVVDINLL